MKKISLQFSENGKKVIIIFEEGKENSIIRLLKQSTIDKLIELLDNGNITQENYNSVLNEVVRAKNLPWGEPDLKRKDIIEIISIEGPSSMALGFGPPPFMMEGIGSQLDNLLLAALFNDDNEEPRQVDEAYLEVCPMCGKNGKIYTKMGRTGEILSKGHALKYVEYLINKGEINEKEVEKLKSEIENSTLPLKTKIEEKVS